MRGRSSGESKSGLALLWVVNGTDCRNAFRSNVFCKSVDEMAVQGMADLYCRLAQEGVAG